MGVLRRVLSVLLLMGLVLGLPAPASAIGAVAAAGAGDVSPPEDCRHCDGQMAMDMAACHGICAAAPALLPHSARLPTVMVPLSAAGPAGNTVRGLLPEPESGPPRSASGTL